jgi:hypothetical protein
MIIRLAIVGGRKFRDARLLDASIRAFCLEHDVEIGEVVSGGATGADALGEAWAKLNHIPTTIYYPKGHHASDYHARNRQIVQRCDMLIAFWDGQSTGTKHSIDFARRLGKHVTVIRYREQPKPAAPKRRGVSSPRRDHT